MGGVLWTVVEVTHVGTSKLTCVVSRHENQAANTHPDLFSLTTPAATTLVAWRVVRDSQTARGHRRWQSWGQGKRKVRVPAQLSQSSASQTQPPHPLHLCHLQIQSHPVNRLCSATAARP